MGWTCYQLVIAMMMVTTGSINTIAAKWADTLAADGKLFDHPFVQTFCMFVGEFLCLVAFLGCYAWKRYRWNKRNVHGEGGEIEDIGGGAAPTLPTFSPFVFLPPACCDIVGSSMIYVGLNLTTASSFQMLRGAVIVFTGLLSVAFLGARLQGFRWLGIFFVTCGLLVVGVADILFNEKDSSKDVNGIITGNLLIVMAQIVVAIQMVYEQKFLSKYDVPPMLAVGLEGIFGMVILGTLMVPMYYIHVPYTFSKSPYGRLEDAIDAMHQIWDQPWIAVALGLTIASIAFFNFAGVSVTKELSATTRMVLDSVRTLIIWALSIPLFHEKFIPLQILGFFLLILGMSVYNELVLVPFFRRHVIPWMSEKGMPMSCCLTFCGLDGELNEHSRLVEDGEDE